MEMIGKRIHELRKNNNMSQEELAKKLSVSSRAVIKWESGETEPSISNLNALADLFHVSADYLLGRDGLSAKSDRKYGNLSIAVSVILILFAICVTIGLVFSTIGMIDQIKTVAEAISLNDSTAQTSPAGLHFALDEVVDKTIEFAASQGVSITKDDATFVQWQTALLGRYTQRGQEFWYNGYILIDYGPMIWMIVLESFLLYSLLITIILFIQNMKDELFSEKISSAVLAFSSFNLPIGFLLLVHYLAMVKK